VPAATGESHTFGLDFSLPDSAPRRGAIVFLVDGVNASVVEKMLEAGELPALKKYFVDRGLYAPRAAAATPSVTLANLTSVVTGVFPGHHGVTGVNWFDRNQLLWRDYETIAQKNTLDGDYASPTLYERMGDELTFSLFFQPHRGATKFYENALSAGPPFVFGWYEFVDRLSLYRFGEAMDIARRYRRFPALTVAYLLAPDFRGYGYGVSSRAYADAMRHTDFQIGRVLGDLERAGLLDDVVIAMVSDHGMVDVARHFGLCKFLDAEAGLKVANARLWDNDAFERRLKVYDKFQAVANGSGDRHWALSLRKPLGGGNSSDGFAPWVQRPSAEELRAYPGRCGPVDLPGILIRSPAVDTVAWSRGADRVGLLYRDGEMEFSQSGGRAAPITCKVVAGQALPGWNDKVSSEALAGKAMTSRQWLEETIDTDFPDLPAQVLAYFRARRAGDLVVFAAPGWDFGKSNRAGHGGLRAEDMLVPLLLAGPGVPHGRVEAARAVDLAPTLLKLLGRDVPSDLDGTPLTP